MMPSTPITAVDSFRRAVEAGDLEGMLELLAPQVRLYNPMAPEPIEGRERMRPVFQVLQRIFQDVRYTRVFAGGSADGAPPREGMQALVFRCRVGSEEIEGIDIFDLDDQGRIATLTVMLPPLAGIYALAEAMAGPSDEGDPGRQ